MPEIKPNFFTSSVPKPEMTQIAFSNDAKFRMDFGMWLYARFNGLTDEYKKHGRFLTLAEIEDNPLTFSDRP